MKVGVSTASLFMRKYNEDALPVFNALGIKLAEVFLATFSEYEESFARLLKARQGDVNIHSLHVLNTQVEPQFFNDSERVRADAYACLDKILQCANILGARYYTFHGIARAKRSAKDGRNDNISKMIKRFQPLLAACEACGVTLCLENVEWATYNRVGLFQTLTSELPKLRGVLDLKQARISDVGFSKNAYIGYLEEMGERLAYAHVSDIDASGKMCLPGRGTFDFDELIRRLSDVGFDGSLIIEVYQNDYKEEKELKIAYDYLNELLYKHGCNDE